MRYIRFADLQERGIFESRMTLKRAIDLHGFPTGILLTPNCRAWTEQEVVDWIKSRPRERKADTRRAA